MKTKSTTLMFLAIVMALTTFACLGGAPTSVPTTNSTEPPLAPTQPTLPKDGKLEILNTHSYVDGYNDYNVVGELVNNTSHVLENITLSLSITDEAGASLLKDDNDSPVDQLEIQPYISVLAPGASTPFNYYISADDIQPAQFEVDIKDYDESSAPYLSKFDIQNVQVSLVGEDVVLTGEVVNLTSDQIDVETLVGAVLDDKGTVLAANSTQTYSHYLYPTGDSQGRDRGPFIVTLFGPIQNVLQWKVYVRPVKSTTFPSTNLDIQLTNSYVDSYGSYHLLGQVTNNGSDQIRPAVIGGLYNTDKVVVDTASLNLPVYLNTGESAPFDISTFNVISSLSADEASPAEKLVKPDLYWTYASDYALISLEKSDMQLIENDFSWTAKGTVTNTSEQALSSITALIQCQDADSQPVALNYASIYPVDGADSIQPGETSEFSIDLYPPADAEELNNCQTFFQGVGAE